MKMIMRFGVLFFLLYGTCTAVPNSNRRVPCRQDPYDTQPYAPNQQECCNSPMYFAFRGFELEEIVGRIPSDLAIVVFNNGLHIFLGDSITLTTTTPEAPYVSWPCDPSKTYTVLLFDADVAGSSYLQWVVVNIPGCNTETGGTTAREEVFTPDEYRVGVHRYVFLVYEQSSTLNAREINSKFFNRFNFNTVTFARTYGLGYPIAGNFATVQYDDPINQQ